MVPMFCLKSNIDNCHVLVSMNKQTGNKIWGFQTDNSKYEKLSGVKQYVNLNFKNWIYDLRKTASKRMSALAVATPFKELVRYFPLIWVCHKCSNSKKMNMLHGKNFSIIYNNK